MTRNHVETNSSIPEGFRLPFWMAVSLFVGPILLTPVLASFEPTRTIGLSLPIFWIFVSLPVGVLTLLDWYRDGIERGSSAKILRHALRIPIFSFGAVAALIGVSVLVWVTYNLFWERQPEYQPGGSLLIIFLLLACGFYLMRLALRPPAFVQQEWDEEACRPRRQLTDTSVLGRRAQHHVDLLFSRGERAEAARLLLELQKNFSEHDEGAFGLDRVRSSILKLSRGDLEQMRKALRLGQRDYRDLLTAAGFGGIDSHLDWEPQPGRPVTRWQRIREWFWFLGVR